MGLFYVIFLIENKGKKPEEIIRKQEDYKWATLCTFPMKFCQSEELISEQNLISSICNFLPTGSSKPSLLTYDIFVSFFMLHKNIKHVYKAAPLTYLLISEIK